MQKRVLLFTQRPLEGLFQYFLQQSYYTCIIEIELVREYLTRHQHSMSQECSDSRDWYHSSEQEYCRHLV